MLNASPLVRCFSAHEGRAVRPEHGVVDAARMEGSAGGGEPADADRRAGAWIDPASSFGTSRASILVRRPFESALKRAFDLIFAASFLAITLPFFLLLVVALQLDSPGNPFFVQKRIGRGGRMFGCIKLRTMRVDAEAMLADLLAADPAARAEWEADRKLRNDPRVSRLGGLVRKLSLDELPQLVNILRGEMSVVGPRPIVQAEIPRYGAHFLDYIAVKPGLTGLWQVSGRNDVSYGERVQLDRIYRRKACFLLDLAIVLRTVPAVLRGSGSY